MNVSKENNLDQKKTLDNFTSDRSEKTFIKYYEQNIRLKKEIEDKNHTIKDLRNKLSNQLNLNKTSTPYSELKSLKQETKKPSHRAMSSTKGSSANLPGQNRKVENLLQIIEHYKGKLQLAEEQSANLRRQKQLLEQDLSLKDKRSHQASMSNDSRNQSQHHQSQQQKHDELLAKLKHKTNELELEKQRNKFAEAEMKRLESQIKVLGNNADELNDLKVQNRIWEERVMKLTLLGDGTDGESDFRATQEKARELELKLESGKEKYKKLKDDHMKLQADQKLLKDKLVETTYSLEQFQKDNLRLKANEVNNPVIQRLVNDPQLLARVIGELERPKSRIELSPAQNVEKLIQEKQLLARTLLEAQERIRSMQENWKEKEALNRLEKEEMMQKINTMPTKSSDKSVFTSKAGVPYDGDISMFSDEMTPVPSGVNFFDIYLGELSLVQSMAHSVPGLASVSSPLILATVDFYNFNTVSTKLVQGYASNFQNEFTFRIVEDEFFYKYLHKGLFKIDIWASEGNKNHHLGTVEISLKPLFLRNKPKISPVINSSAPIYLGQKIMGTIAFDMRMRMPIYEQTSKILDLAHTLPEEDTGARRKLVVQIEDGYNFREKSNIFVYYPFRMEDFYTKTSKGPSPKWNHYKILEVVYNTDLKNYLRKNDIEFTLFDDNAMLYDEKDSDVVGSGVLRLDKLLQDKPLKERLEIRKKGEKVGSVDVKIFWYESKEAVQQSKSPNSKEEFLASLHQDIKRYLSETGSNPESEFHKIDDNRTGMISFSEFNVWVTKVRQSHKYSQQLIGQYYDTFPQPVNLINWVTRLSQKDESQKHSEDLIAEFGMINKMLHKNSVQIGGQVSLKEYMRGKDAIDVSLEIDRDKNGKISKQQLMSYMEAHNIRVTSEEAEGVEQVKLVEFLQKYAEN